MLIHRSVFRFVPYRLRKMLNVQAQVRVNLGGQEFIIPMGISGELVWNMFSTKSWKSELIGRLFDPDDGIFIDVGANIGQTLLDLRIAHPGARYVGFEPNVTCVSYLKELIRANVFQNCLIIPVGLAEENRVLPFYRHKDDATDSRGTILSDLRPSRSYDIDFIPCFRFDDIRHSLKIRDVAFVKIDVEGTELETLTGMRMSIQEYRPLIACEVLFTDSKADLSSQKVRNDRLMQLITDLNYSVLQLIKPIDDAHVVDAKKIQDFPSAYWTLENKNLCDYLFIPEKKEAHVLSALHAGK